MTLPYETIFSRTRGRISDMKELSLDENDLNETWTERLHMVAGDERVIQTDPIIHMSAGNDYKKRI